MQIPAQAVAAAAPAWPLLVLALSTVLSAGPMQQQQHFWARQGQHNPHRCLHSDGWVLHAASATCYQHLDGPWSAPISPGRESSRGCSIPVSHAISLGMLEVQGGAGRETATA